MKRMRLLSLLLALVLVCTAMPVTAAAADGLASATVCTTHTVHTEGQSAEDCTGLAPYLAPDGTAWAAVGDDTTKVKTWHCFQQDIDAALTDALHRMLRRETAFTLYIAVEKSDYDPTTDNLQTALYERLRSNALAEKAGTIEGGDFLDAQIQDFRQDDLKISWLNVEGYDDWNGPVAFYEVHCTFKYCDTVQQMEILRQAAEKWNQLFVTDNPTIAAEKDTNRRQYLIVKTIYDFLAENTVYNTAAYENFMNHQVTDWYAHTAYAAFFGLTGQGATDLDGTGLDYVGEEGEFSLLIPGYVFGREYTTVYETGDDRYAPGQHTIIATDGTAQLSCSFYLNKIDVTKEKNQIELHNLDKNGAITYNVCPIQVDVHVVDGYGHTAVRDKDYTVLFLDENGTQVDTLSEPGKYTIVLDFSISDRYTGKLEGNGTNRLRFEIAKLPMNRAGFGDVQAPYSGKSIADVMSAMTFVGTTTDGKPYKKTFKEGEDYTLTYSGSTVHAGSGTYTVTALEGSKYLIGSATYTYTIAPASIAGYGGSDVCAPVTYNGSAQRPGTAWFDSQSGLKSGRDYTVVRYSANTNAGIANVTVQGKGDYTGTAVLHFKINQKSLNDRDVSVRCTPTAKGATIKATYKGKTLRQNKDYTVSIATRGTTRTVTVQGKGNFNSRRQFKIHVHAYKCTAKKAATYFATGYKKYKCTACGAKKTEKLAQLKPAIASLKSSKKGRLTVKWKKGSGISGYQISYSTSSKFTKSTTKSVTITKAGSTAKTLTKLKSKKKYYVRIRVYKKQKGGKLYGAWSPVKSTKVR